MKNKFLLIILIAMSLLMAACSKDSPEVIYIENANMGVEVFENDIVDLEKSEDDIIAIVDFVEVDEQSKNDFNVNASEYDMEVITLRDELGRDYEKLTEVQIEILSAIYDEIAEFEFTDDNEYEYDELWLDFNYKLKYMGLDVPYTSYSELADEYQSIFSIIDYNRIITIDEKLQLTGDDAINDKKYEKLSEEIIIIFDKYELPGKEVKNQVDMGNVQLALFDIKNGEITLSKNSIKSNIAIDEIELYEKFWKHIKTIIPTSYLDMLSKFEINTDGIGNVMAHVVEEETDLSVWRLAVDLKDSANADGEFTSVFDNTVIHEFAHVMTLNKNQMQMEGTIDRSTFEVQEGMLKKDAYLNKFYEKFWKDIYTEHQNALDEDFENGMPSGGDALFEFYQKYEDRFVTDYAATNPGEDIAESYKFFVVDDKPTGNTIKDKKVLFFYDMEDFVKIRDEIRRNLGL